MVVEVADSSLPTDRAIKGPIYAAAGIPVYWIVNTADRRVEVYTNPQPAASGFAYADRTDVLPGGTLPVVLDGALVLEVPVADLFD